MLSELYSKHRNAYILPHCLSTKAEVEVVKFKVSNFVSGILIDGKIDPSRMEGNPNRPNAFYERTIEVSEKIMIHVNKYMEENVNSSIT